MGICGWCRSQVSSQPAASDPDYESPSKRTKFFAKETTAEAARDSIAKRTRRYGRLLPRLVRTELLVLVSFSIFL